MGTNREKHEHKPCPEMHAAAPPPPPPPPPPQVSNLCTQFVDDCCISDDVEEYCDNPRYEPQVCDKCKKTILSRQDRSRLTLLVCARKHREERQGRDSFYERLTSLSREGKSPNTEPQGGFSKHLAEGQGESLAK